jgi:2-amino-4-hydroxy-6-hydroxymethyldihydropteridine diphosphokinase
MALPGTEPLALNAAPRFTAWVALGGNLGDVPATFRQALAAMASLPGTRLLGASALFETTPWEAQGPVFHNAVAALDTALGAGELLRTLLAIEARLGRERPFPNAPRTLDLDLLAHGDRVAHAPELSLPHPRAHERAFVLAPWADLCARLAMPGRNVGAAPSFLSLMTPLPSPEALAALCAAQGARLAQGPEWASAS